MHLDLDVVTSVARLLYGDNWQRPLARGLGPLHPAGARESIDDRLVRRWAAGQNLVPGWVGSALVTLLEEEAAALVGALRQMGLDREQAAALVLQLWDRQEESP